jgi:hypothetical protein
MSADEKQSSALKISFYLLTICRKRTYHLIYSLGGQNFRAYAIKNYLYNISEIKQKQNSKIDIVKYSHNETYIYCSNKAATSGNNSRLRLRIPCIPAMAIP